MATKQAKKKQPSRAKNPEKTRANIIDIATAEFAERDQPRQIGPRRAEGRPPVRQIERA